MPGRILWRPFYAPGKGKTVALTFDDGPGRTTAAVLRVLARYRVPATFFNIGVNVAARPGLARKEARDGYAMGNHTWNHPNMVLLAAAQQAAEMDRMSARLRAAAGVLPCVFRPPYGDYDSVTLRLAHQRRMGVWLWSVDTQDAVGDRTARQLGARGVTVLAGARDEARGLQAGRALRDGGADAHGSQPAQRVPFGHRGSRGQRPPCHPGSRRPQRHPLGRPVDGGRPGRRLRPPPVAICAGFVTTTMSHRGAPDHHSVTSSWLPSGTASTRQGLMGLKA